MKIKKANAGPLTNFEELDFLRSKGASKDSAKRIIAEVHPSELKVFDYLVESVACDQTRECIIDFTEKSRKYDLAKAELLNIINIRPSSAAQVNPLIEATEQRFPEGFETELADLIEEVLPQDPNQPTQEVVAEE